MRAVASFACLCLSTLGVAVASNGSRQAIPADLAVLLTKAGLGNDVAAWCRAEFRSDRRGGAAVAVSSAGGGGRYLALDADGTVVELGSFRRTADLSCYTRAQARDLDATIRRSDTISGHVTPRWNTTVVCGFVDETVATCWQYSPGDRIFVKIGEWVT